MPTVTSPPLATSPPAAELQVVGCGRQSVSSPEAGAGTGADVELLVGGGCSAVPCPPVVDAVQAATASSDTVSTVATATRGAGITSGLRHEVDQLLDRAQQRHLDVGVGVHAG